MRFTSSIQKTIESSERQSCLIKDHSFIQQGDEWIDPAVESMPDARRIRIRFDSREFFELLIKHPKVLSYFSGARQLKLVLDDTVYEIYE